MKPLAAQPEAARTTASTASGRLGRVEDRLAALVDRLNPILVKETRQALKSRQFVITFLIVLAGCWIVSFAGVAMIGPQIRYAAAGGVMLIAYYAILAFPLTVIVPFSAFRSLAAEQEDNTYELLSITTLSSGQIIAGKLCSAIVQMLVYFCAVSPCIAFTFLLRGVETVSTAVLLVLTALASIGLSMVALLVGTLTKVRYTQVVISVALVLGLAGAFLAAVYLAADFQRQAYLYLREPSFWVAIAAMLTLLGTTFGLLFSAAAAQIAFSSENRSTRVRWWMVIQQASLLGWLAVAIGESPRSANPDIVAAGAVWAIAYWFVMGALMTGEWPHLSRRVQRSLPQSLVGRALLSWFNPGPGAGYMFAVANLTMLAIVGSLVVHWSGPITASRAGETAVYLLLFGWSYVTALLGAGRLLIGLARRFAFVSMSGALLIQLILVLAGVGLPMLLQMISSQLGSGFGYSLIHLLDPLKTLRELSTRGAGAVPVDILRLILPAAAIIVLVLNLRSVVAELHRQRIAAPTRVLEEEATLHPVAPVRPANPWDADEARST